MYVQKGKSKTANSENQCALPYLDPPPINNGNGCNRKHCNGEEDGADNNGEEVVVCDVDPALHDGVGGEVVEGAGGVAGVAGQGGRPLHCPEVGVQVPVDTLLQVDCSGLIRLLHQSNCEDEANIF